MRAVAAAARGPKTRSAMRAPIFDYTARRVRFMSREKVNNVRTQLHSKARRVHLGGSQRTLVGILPNLNIESSTDLIVDLAHKRRHRQSVPRALRALSTNRSRLLYAAKGWSHCVRVFIERYSLVLPINDFRVVKWVRRTL